MRNLALLGLALCLSVPVVATEAFRFSLLPDDDGVETVLAQHVERGIACDGGSGTSLRDIARYVTPQGQAPVGCP